MAHGWGTAAPPVLHQDRVFVVSDNEEASFAAAYDKLTGREVDVLRLLARGFTNAEIAAQLHLSEGTVRNHVSAIFAKMDVSDRTQAAVIAIQHGLGEG